MKSPVTRRSFMSQGMALTAAGAASSILTHPALAQESQKDFSQAKSLRHSAVCFHLALWTSSE
jgi:hypothetical protein